MSFAQQAYRRSTQTQWSRIDLLVALYSATEKTLLAGAAAVEQGDFPLAGAKAVHARKQLLAILEGVEPGPDGGADNVRRLLTFCHSCLNQNTAASWNDAARIIRTLRLAFEGVQEEARQLEAAGEIPSLDVTSRHAVVA
jgi:flagellin-specific chaperone FliS